MAYTETEENLRREHEEMLSLCPKGWAWVLGDCDFGQDCDNCKEPLAPILIAERRKGMKSEPYKHLQGSSDGVN